MASGKPPPGGTRYLYYLHGKTVEDLGPRGVVPRFGAFDHSATVEALRREGVHVLTEVRPKDTDPSSYADKIVAEVRARIRSGVPASHITVAGASKGGTIASLVSSRLEEEKVRYVLISTCSDRLIREIDTRVTGEILSIYEASDQLVQSCAPLVARSPAVKRFKEIRLETGLGHGMHYRPMREWIGPTGAWARR